MREFGNIIIKLIEELDSQGNELSQQQELFFKNSVIRDTEGNLLVCSKPSKELHKYNWFVEGIAKNTECVVYINSKHLFDCGNTEAKSFDGEELTQEFKTILSRLKINEDLAKKKFRLLHSLPLYEVVRSSIFCELVYRSGYDCIKSEEQGKTSYGVVDRSIIKMIDDVKPSK